MIRTVAFAGVIAACLAGMMMGCSKKDNPVAPVDTPSYVQAQRIPIFTEGFESDLSSWDPNYLVVYPEPIFTRMRITDAAAYTGGIQYKNGSGSTVTVAAGGTHAITTDSGSTALIYRLSDAAIILDSIAGVEFYIMAKALGQANLTLEIGKTNGSSGGLASGFGIGFDQNDSIKCMFEDFIDGRKDTMIAPIQLNKWYKCVVEVDFRTTKTITYYINDVKVRTLPFPSSSFNQIDRLLVLRGLGDVDQNNSLIPASEGPKQYYADDIFLYQR